MTQTNHGEVIFVYVAENKDGQVQMITTIADPAEVLWYMEAARFGIMTGGLEDE